MTPTPEVAPLLPLLRLLPAERLVVEDLERLVERGLVVARVVREAGGDGVGELVLGDEVLPPHFDRIHADPAGEDVQQPLDQVRGLGPARAAVRIHRRAGGVHAVDGAEDVGNLVHSRIHQAVQNGGNAWPRGRRVRAEAGVHLGADAGDPAVPGSAHLDVLDVVAAVDGRLVVLAPVLGPLDRPPELHGGEAHQRLVRVRRDLAAEAAAHLGRDDPDPMLRELEHHRAEEAVDVGVLARGPERELPGALVVARHGGTALHGRWKQPLLHDPLRDRHVRALERGLGVAAGHDPGERDVVGDLVVALRRSGLRHLLGIDSALQRVVVHVDQVDRVPRLGPRLGDHHCDAVAHVAHLVVREQRMRRAP